MQADVFAHVLFQIGPPGFSLEITDSIITVWLITLVLAGIGFWLSRHLSRNIVSHPGILQLVTEGTISAVESAVREVLPQYYRLLTPFILSLWLFLGVANLIGLIPGFESPTRDLSVTAALAIIVFFSVHWFGIRTQGVRKYFKHYLSPSPILLPFHIISEVSRTIALAVRLFGNMISLEMVGMILLLVAGFLMPVPIMMLHIIEALVQAYIFGMLALIFIASAIQTQEQTQEQAQAQSLKNTQENNHE